MRDRIGVIGLGYVGLPLAVAFSKCFETIGFDVNSTRIKSLNEGIDYTGEVESEELSKSLLRFSEDISELQDCTFYIVTVPTPVHENKAPDLSFLKSACALVGGVISQGDIVVFESTVFPGCTEEVCLPILQDASGKKLGQDFTMGYSPERINPADKSRRVSEITKVVSGSDDKTLDRITSVYGEVITAGIYRATSIKVAEAAKVIENVQRDVNIALINELSKLFSRLNIDTKEVLDAAGTKWNFLNFTPGLVGGHCIGVDPYYLSNKAAEVDFYSELILAARRVNDSMASHAGALFIKELSKKGYLTTSCRVLIIGATFKENCPDMRNSKVADLVRFLCEHEINVDIFDPFISHLDGLLLKKATLVIEPSLNTYDGVILAVPHDIILSRGLENLKKLGKVGSIFFDLKSVYPRSDSDLRL